MCTFFYVFLRFIKIQKKHDFLRFFELLHTFSRTVPTISIRALKGTVSHSTLTSISPGDFPALTLTTAGYIGGKIWSVKDTEDKRGGSNEGQDDTKPADEHGAELTNCCEGQRDSQPAVDDTQTER